MPALWQCLAAWWLRWLLQATQPLPASSSKLRNGYCMLQTTPQQLLL